MGSQLSEVAPRRGMRPARRGWRVVAVVALGALLAMATASYVVRQPGMYYSRVSVLFLAPLSAQYPNRFISGSESLTATAGVVRDLVNEDAQSVGIVSDGVSLPSLGIHHGFSVILPNSGGQWAINFDKAQLDVQAVGSTPDEVTAMMNKVIDAINSSLLALQVEAQADPVNRISTRNDPPVIPVYFIQGSRIRALATSLSITVGLTVLAAAAMRAEPWRRRETDAEVAAAPLERVPA